MPSSHSPIESRYPSLSSAACPLARLELPRLHALIVDQAVRVRFVGERLASLHFEAQHHIHAGRAAGLVRQAGGVYRHVADRVPPLGVVGEAARTVGLPERRRLQVPQAICESWGLSVPCLSALFGTTQKAET